MYVPPIYIAARDFVDLVELDITSHLATDALSSEINVLEAVGTVAFTASRLQTQALICALLDEVLRQQFISNVITFAGLVANSKLPTSVFEPEAALRPGSVHLTMRAPKSLVQKLCHEVMTSPDAQLTVLKIVLESVPSSNVDLAMVTDTTSHLRIEELHANYMTGEQMMHETAAGEISCWVLHDTNGDGYAGMEASRHCVDAERATSAYLHEKYGKDAVDDTQFRILAAAPPTKPWPDTNSNHLPPGYWNVLAFSSKFRHADAFVAWAICAQHSPIRATPFGADSPS
jgi:hypothetical protein